MEYLNQKLETQQKQIEEIINQEKTFQNKISQEIDEEMSKFINNLKLLNDINPQKFKNPIKFGFANKISEFNKKIAQNEEIIKKNKEKIPDILRKKKESEEFFNKFMGEKKVWLDRLKEKKLQQIADKGFKYLYEAKTVKLLIEGILLVKIEDEIEKEMIKKGSAFGWDSMNEELFEIKRKEKEFQFNLKFVNEVNREEEIINMERNFKENLEKEEKEFKEKSEEYQKELKELWGEIWVPGYPYSGDDLIPKRTFIQKLMMDVIFRIFKKEMYDIWKFKNILNNKEEYIIMEKIKRYLIEINNNDFINHSNINNQKKDEDAFEKMINIIEGLRREEEIIYLDLKPVEERLNNFQKTSTGEDNESYKRIFELYNKITKLKEEIRQDPYKLIKREVEDIYGMIKNLPDENEKKLFRDNLIDDSRLYDVFLPLTTLLMIITYLSIGVKRKKNYENQLEEIAAKNEKLSLEIEEMKGKLKTLNEINNKIKDNGEENRYLIEYNNAKNSLDELTKMVLTQKEDINQQQNQLFDDIQNSIVKPLI